MGIIAYFISDLFANVYMVACYAILQCYYVDQEISEKKGGQGVVRRTPEHLRDFFDEEDKKREYEEEELKKGS